jgi:hypothetical protein
VLRKLPYDEGTNALVAADKFVIREHLNKAYVEQINTFIRNNSNPMTTRDPSERKKKGTTEGGTL